VLSPLLLARERFSRTAFIVMATFFLYYTIYLFLPVSGPQYYFCAIGLDQAAAGHFPAVADGYFALHQQMLPSPGPDGLFRTLVEQAQAGGERPTAAFPSSHVGAATVLMLLMYRTRRWLTWLMMPLYLLLVGATVYIQAHYLVDVFGGLATGVLFYIILDRLYPHVERRFAGTRPPFA
ncbi:MAG: phosphatase PAP2 family protein, partial [Bacteroidales bacterium]|nr:phosphatase PAP2 family protein [Bacteroidales bacterium]